MAHSSWHWQADPPPPRHDPSEQVLARRFASQGEAETWLGELYLDLLASGVRAVSLYEADRLVYGPMSLEA